MLKINLQIATAMLLLFTCCAGNPAEDSTTETAEDSLSQRTPLPSPQAIEANLESINARDSIFSMFQTIACISYGDPIEKVREIFGAPSKIYEPDPEISYYYYFNTAGQRQLSFQYNPQQGNVVETIFYGPEVDIFDSVPDLAAVSEFKAFMHEKCASDPRLDFVGMRMEEIKTLFEEVGTGGFGSDLWSRIYESSYMDVKFIRMNAAETCGEINVFWRY